MNPHDETRTPTPPADEPTSTQPPPSDKDASDAAWDAGLAAAFGVAETRSYTPPADPEPGTVIAGRYQLSQRIGEGGMGSVWVAHQSEPVKRKVAVKLIKAGMDSRSVLARFEAERQALAVMDHPNIAKILDGGVTDFPSGGRESPVLDGSLDRSRGTYVPRSGVPFFVMELVKGVPITEFCDARKLTPRQRLELFVPVCQAIQHAHQKGIIHRDIKPSNVLIALYDNKPVPKVIDFGVAKATGGTLTEHTIETAFGGVVGTPQYMSPEQASLNNLDIDTRSDVYALGVLLYELLTGSPPFSSAELKKKGLLEILRVVREEEPPRPSTKLSTANVLSTLSANRGTEPKKLTGLLRNELDWIVMKALEKDRSRRYETANGFAADVQRFLSGEAVQAHPPSATYRLKKFVRRNKGQVIAAGLVTGVLLAGVIGTSIGLWQADTARREAEVAAKRESEERQKADLARAEAVAAQEQTLIALRDATEDAIQKLIGSRPTLGQHERAYLESALKRWQTIADKNGDTAETRDMRGEGALRVAILRGKLGDRDAAILGCRESIAIREKLTADFPNVPLYRTALGTSYNTLALLLTEHGKGLEADEQYLRALDIRRKLADDYPNEPDHRRNLAEAIYNRARNWFDALGKRAEAEAGFREALSITQKLVQEFSGNATYRGMHGGCLNMLGVVLMNLGKQAESEQRYRESLDVYEKLVAEFPEEPAYRVETGYITANMAVLLRRIGNRLEAEKRTRQSLAIRQQLANDFPAVTGHRRNLADSHIILGNMLHEFGKPTDAVEQHRSALALYLKLAAEYPKVPDYRQWTAACHNNIGRSLLYVVKKRDEAEEQFRQALAIQEKLAVDFPSKLELLVHLGGSYCNLGGLVRDGGRPEDSLVWYRKAIDTLRAVHEKEPRDVTAKLFLGNSYAGRAEALHAIKRYLDAISDWNQAIQLRPKQLQPGLRASRATSKVNAGQVADAVVEVTELRKLPGWNAGQLYDFACVYSIASGKLADQKEEYAKRAVELLQRAVNAGYKDAAHMKKDPDLEPLRGREDFKKLIAELEAKAEKK